jgi:hypothetical protein
MDHHASPAGVLQFLGGSVRGSIVLHDILAHHPSRGSLLLSSVLPSRAAVIDDSNVCPCREPQEALKPKLSSMPLMRSPASDPLFGSPEFRASNGTDTETSIVLIGTQSKYQHAIHRHEHHSDQVSHPEGIWRLSDFSLRPALQVAVRHPPPPPTTNHECESGQCACS